MSPAATGQDPETPPSTSTSGESMSVRILALVGSVRSGSHNHQLAEATVKHAPEGVEVTVYEGLAEVPFYNEDIDTDAQRSAAAARRHRMGRESQSMAFFRTAGMVPLHSGGVSAQDDARKSAGIGGAAILEDARLAIPGSVTRFAETHPGDDAEATEQLMQEL
ncbi:FMN reductase [Rhodococcus sp. WS4]|nr:FMN reductase [Rhodococcus sp. WS4]